MAGDPFFEWLGPCRTCDTVHIASHMLGRDGRVDSLRRVVATLTPQEFEVFTRLAGGLTNQDLAEALSVTGATVKAHLTIIRRKLAVVTRAHLVLAANMYNASVCTIDSSSDDHVPSS